MGGSELSIRKLQGSKASECACCRCSTRRGGSYSNQMVDQTGKSMAQSLSEMLTVRKLWSTAVLVRFWNCSLMRNQGSSSFT
ncbi:unnamed protein product [Lupinus luteus]|uniref:Uncharacterized protein n=1 Tax=Lupinus luteus TaxID=3873 RepID=A0AAV1WA12_LUPLU